MMVKFWLNDGEEVVDEVCEVPNDFDDDWGYAQIDRLLDEWLSDKPAYMFGLIEETGWTKET